MRFFTSAAIGAAIVLATPACAETAAPVDPGAEFAGIFAQLRPVAEAAGFTPQMLEQRIGPLVRAAVPVRPDDGKTWGFAMLTRTDRPQELRTA